MTLLGRPMPRTDDATRPLGAGQPMWMVISQAYLILFLFAGFDLFKFNPKPLFLLDMVLVGSIVLLAPRGLLRSMRLSIPVIAFMSWWIASFAWTPMIGDWFNKTSVQLGAVMILALIASVLPWERLVPTLLAFVYVAIGYSLYYTATHYFAATTLIDVTTGRLVNAGWRGAFPHKNQLAVFMVMGMIIVLAFEKHKVRRRAAVAVMVALVLLSRSGTGGGCLAAVSLSFFWCGRYARSTARKGSALIVVSFFASIIGAGLAATFVPAFLELYGKDATLSGRTEIWSAVLGAIAQRPWTGYSWGGVWINPASEPTFSIIRELGFIVFHAHNGPLEIMLELGVIGLVLYLWMFFSVMVGGWRLLRIAPDLGRVIVGYTVLLLVASFSEVFNFGPWFALLVMFHVMGMRARREQDPQPRRRLTKAVLAMEERERAAADAAAVRIRPTRRSRDVNGARASDAR